MSEYWLFAAGLALVACAYGLGRARALASAEGDIRALHSLSGHYGWPSLVLVIDYHTRELLGWYLARSGKAPTASAALEHALIAQFGTLGRVDREFLPRSDNGLVFTSRHFTALVRSYGLRQEFITPHCPQQNGMVKRLICTLKEQCVHHHRFESIQHATRVTGDWISFYNHRRPPLPCARRAEAFRLAA